MLIPGLSSHVEFSKAEMFPVHKRVEQLKTNHMIGTVCITSLMVFHLNTKGRHIIAR